MAWRRVAAAIALAFLVASCASGQALAPAHPEGVPKSPADAASMIGSSHSVKLKGFNVLDISFVDDRHGFALGGFTSAPITAVLRTSDGGRHWKTMASTPHPEAHIEFSTPRLGWAYGPDLYVTTDGGQTWEQQETGGPTVAVAGAARSVWAVTGHCHVEPCSFRIRISSDAGRSWLAAQLPAPISSEGMDMARVGDVGWVVGATASPNGTVSLLRTTNGGRTWEQLQDPCDRFFHYGIPFKPIFEAHLAPIGARELWLRCTSEPAGGSSEGVLFTSTDAGTRWHLAFEGPSANELHVAALSLTNGWETDATAGPWLVRITTDGRFHRPVVALDSGWTDFQFVDARHGWVATGTTVYRTSDGGAQWVGARLHPSGCG
jgi:photosystem II stability/assembly factor-like uncharacterized protein